MRLFASCPTNTGHTNFELLDAVPQTKMMIMIIMIKTSMYNTFAVALRVRFFFNAISFWGVSNEPPSLKHSSSMSIILQWLSSP